MGREKQPWPGPQDWGPGEEMEGREGKMEGWRDEGVGVGLGLISSQTNWEEKGPHMLCLTSQPAGEKVGGGGGGGWGFLWGGASWNLKVKGP